MIGLEWDGVEWNGMELRIGVNWFERIAMRAADLLYSLPLLGIHLEGILLANY